MKSVSDEKSNIWEQNIPPISACIASATKVILALIGFDVLLFLYFHFRFTFNNKADWSDDRIDE